MYTKWKNNMDRCIAVVMLLLLAPLLGVIALLVWVKLDRKIIFSQERVGLHEKIFKIYKFKTMTDERDAEGQLLPDNERLHPFGNALRKLSLDELPQLMNVIKGDMNFIGPRPLLKEYLAFYSEEEKKRHHTKPGLSGWAQVNGRNSISWQEKFQLDLYYVENQSLKLDMLIYKKTMLKVIRREDVNTSEQVTMERLDEIKHA
ncbi:undecaprenyl-phosphate galactose phosphotransferase [Listeria grandensis FSL F6-0971]|uniref:Undecaprenyl-phosphate galactose phosphotransferase n=1 Tax=Listeria grandensis FSL F6-0971 TaxID=1265819 RepID=W7BGJ4_9LIST|nr:sugar transferase [Listeria grandensis]EUJ23945.1 undecaprenyl-phosphate galactose phosphotransferase [Listeria grandensis FSL F6-0971]